MESLNLSDAVKDLKEVDDPIYIGTGPTPFVVNPAGPGGFFKFQIRYGLRCHREKPYPVKRISTTKGLSFFLRVSAKLPLFVSVQEDAFQRGCPERSYNCLERVRQELNYLSDWPEMNLYRTGFLSSLGTSLPETGLTRKISPLRNSFPSELRLVSSFDKDSSFSCFLGLSFHRHTLQSNQLSNFRGPRISLLIPLEPTLVFRIKLPI
ncbi:hypothetical protein RIF29_48444 [Crotalaria pallida]